MIDGEKAFFDEESEEPAEENEEERPESPASTEGQDAADATAEERTIIMPDVQDMDHFVRRHYRSYILAQLNEMLVSGELSELLDKVIVSEQISRDDCQLTDMTYWRVDRTTFLADIDVQVMLTVEQGSIDVQQPFVLYISLLIDDDFECTVNEVGRQVEKPDRDTWKLDRFLVPILRVEEMEQAAEDIWMKMCPQAMEEASMRKAKALAQMYQLNLVSLRLSKRKGTRSILFFREGTIMVQDEGNPGEKQLPPPRPVPVAANTIVLNLLDESSDEGEYDIFHECIHYEWHYLFYRLQDMCNDDVQQIKTRKITVKKDKEPGNPIHFMEAQAYRGGYGLMMPASVMHEKVYREFQRACTQRNTNGYYKHDGWKYDCVARAIASDFQLKKFRVRARLLMLGYSAAKGALNYADGRYIVPFAFSSSFADKGKETYVINRKGIFSLYERDRRFRDLMKNGDFVYVDGHLCYSSAEFIRMTPDGVRLTPWANAHVDCCCLRFSTVYVKEHSPEYTFGAMNSDEEYDRHYNEYLDKTISKTAKERLEAKNKLMASMPLSFHEALEYLMQDHGNGKITVEKLAEHSQVSQRTIIRLRNEERQTYKLDLVIAICIGLHLPPWLSEVLLERAHLCVKRYGAFGYYGELLDCCFMDKVEDIQKFLLNNGQKPLDLSGE